MGQDRQLVRVVLGLNVLPYNPSAVDFRLQIMQGRWNVDVLGVYRGHVSCDGPRKGELD